MIQVSRTACKPEIRRNPRPDNQRAFSLCTKILPSTAEMLPLSNRPALPRAKQRRKQARLHAGVEQRSLRKIWEGSMRRKKGKMLTAFQPTNECLSNIASANQSWNLSKVHTLSPHVPTVGDMLETRPGTKHDRVVSSIASKN